MINDMIPLQLPKRVLTRTFQNTEYTIRLCRPIGDIDEFEEEIMALEEASPNDIVKFQISSPGGDLETCVFLCERMNECQAPIVVEIGLLVASAASALTLQADDWIIKDSSTMMVHACSYSPGYGKEVDVRTSVAYTERVNREWVERTYKGFLTESELQQVLDGKDLYFYADDLRDRLPKYKEYRKQNNPCDCGSCGVESDEESFDLVEMIEDIAEKKALEVLEKQKPIPRSRKQKTEQPE